MSDLSFFISALCLAVVSPNSVKFVDVQRYIGDNVIGKLKNFNNFDLEYKMLISLTFLTFQESQNV